MMRPGYLPDLIFYVGNEVALLIFFEEIGNFANYPICRVVSTELINNK